jgi:hypothetical protein
MLKSHIFIFLLPISCFTPTHCMLSEWKYKPYIQPLNDEITDMRIWLNMARKNIIEINPNIIILRPSTQQEEKWRCFTYAIAQITGSTTPLFLDKNNDKLASISIEKFFEQIVEPQPQYLVIYTTNKEHRAIQHLACAVNTTTFESKWGTRKAIIHHRLFDVPSAYGTAASFWILKKEFTTSEGKELLLETIEKDATAAFLQWQKANATSS